MASRMCAPAFKASRAAWHSSPMARMSSASVSTHPFQPSFSFNNPVVMAADKEAGSRASNAGTFKCPVITPSASGSKAANGFNSAWNSSSGVRLKTGKAKWESTRVCPCPGKCFRQLSAPPFASPFISAPAKRITACGWAEKARVFTMGLSGVSAKSATGANTQSTPNARAARAVKKPFSKASSWLSAAPRAILGARRTESFTHRPRPSS